MSDDRAPDRPADDSFDELGFRRRPPTRWLAPRQLTRTTLRTLIAHVAGGYTDRREVLAALDPRPTVIEDLDLSDRSELWFDHVADSGDGFAAGYAVAWTLAQDELVVTGAERALPAGELLVFGGDQVYPVSSDESYRDRLVGPYRAALPWRAADSTRHTLAIPGNHDWYDGLGAFTRRFCQHRWLGAWRTAQHRSYFAARLPHHWWLWGTDISLSGLVDQPQRLYFDAMARRAADLAAADGAEARLVIATAKPTWLAAEPGADEEVRRDVSLDYLENGVARRHGLRVAAVLTGDVHHYTRHEPRGDGPHRVVCGGGGAFLHPTDHVPDRLSIAHRGVAGSERDEEYELAAVAPSASQSRLLRLRGVALGWHNGALPAVTALVYLGWLLPGAGRVAFAAFVGLVLAGLARRPTTLGGLQWGIPHAAAHVGVMSVAVVAADAFVESGDASTWWRALALTLAGAVVAPVVMGLYFVVAGTVAGVNDNEAFSAIRVRDHRGFLRLHVDGRGRLRMYPIGLPRVPPASAWTVAPDGPPGSPWLAPADGQGPTARLLEDPVDLTPAP